MSLFETNDVECPSCGASVSFDLVYSVNADRKPELREAILDETFQSQDCPACGRGFRIEPELTYLHVRKGIWIGCWQTQRLAEWEVWAAQAQASFDKSFGANASPAAKTLGAELTARVTFGWSALREKIIVLENDISDVTLEVVKAHILRQEGEAPRLDADLRLIDLTDDDLVFAWVEREMGLRRGTFAVDRGLLGAVEAEAEAFAPLREAVDGGMHVDLQRMTLAPSA